MNATTETINALSVRNFSGFYETIWYNSDSLYYAADYFETPGVEYDINFAEYTADVARAFFDAYETEILNLFPEGLINLDFAGLYSPKYYNFETDEILYNLTINDPETFKIHLLQLIEEHREKLTAYIKKRFSNRSGFISFYSSKLEDWEDTIKEDEAGSVEFSVLIDFFILENDPEIEYTIYEYLNGNGYNIENFAFPEPESLAVRLNELRAAIEAENISYSEIIELQNLAAWIPEDDKNLLQWAGIPENPEDYRTNLIC